MTDYELEDHATHASFKDGCYYCQAEKNEKKQKEIEDLSKDILSREKWCVILDRPCLKERCSWYDISEERCIVITIANILAGQRAVR